MYVVTGITGQVGSATAKALLKEGLSVRGVVRSQAKGIEWAQRGCALSIADMRDVHALTQAFAGADGVFVLLPSNFDPAPGFSETRDLVATLRAALLAGKPKKVVCLSTVGAHAKQINLLTQLQILEQELRSLPMPTLFLRAAWFMENFAGDIASARNGILPSFLQPLDRAIPMVATVDVGNQVAALLQQTWEGSRIVELEGPELISPNAAAALFGLLMRHLVKAQGVPRENWEILFRTQGMLHPAARMQMLDGFNAGWIEFEGQANNVLKGPSKLEAVLRGLLERTAQ